MDSIFCIFAARGIRYSRARCCPRPLSWLPPRGVYRSFAEIPIENSRFSCLFLPELIRSDSDAHYFLAWHCSDQYFLSAIVLSSLSVCSIPFYDRSTSDFISRGRAWMSLKDEAPGKRHILLQYYNGVIFVLTVPNSLSRTCSPEHARMSPNHPSQTSSSSNPQSLRSTYLPPAQTASSVIASST